MLMTVINGLATALAKVARPEDNDKRASKYDLPKVKRYTGESRTVDLDEFLEDCDSRCDLQKYNDERRREFLMSRLKGSAKTALKAVYQDDNTTYAAMKA